MTEKIIRRPDYASGPLTKEEKLALGAHKDKWVDIIMRVDPIEPGKIIPAIETLYQAAGLDKPRVVIVPSPIVMAFAGGAASWIWHRKEKNEGGINFAWNSEEGAEVDAVTAAVTEATLGIKQVTKQYTFMDVAAMAAQACKAIAGKEGLECARKWTQAYQGGNMWGQYECYLTACRDILGLQLKEFEPYAAWEQAAIHGGFRWMHKEFCMVSDFPETIKIDDQNRPHCEDGPSHKWRDGWSLWHIHGVRVTEQIVMRPETITVGQIDSEGNAEVRRVLIDRYGMEKYVKDSGATVVCEYGDEHPIVGLRTARLLRKDLEGDEPIILLDMLNSTPEPDGSTKRYMIRIDRDAYDGAASLDCLAAMASTYRNPDGSLLFPRPDEYLPISES